MKTLAHNKFIKKAITVVTVVCPLLAAIITTLTGVNEAYKILSNFLGMLISIILIIGNFILLPYAIFVFLLVCGIYASHKYRKKIGTHGIPISFIYACNFKLANKNNKLLKSIHKDIYHYYYKLKDDVHNHKINSKKELDGAIQEFLRVIHSSILKTFGLDLTINIKKLFLDREDNKLYLVPFVHYRNVAERNIENPREFNYKYYVEPHEYAGLSRYARRAKTCIQNTGNDRNFEVNSIFTYLITQNTRYWMSNNLRIDEKNDNFFTSSDNFPNYYQSIAVFSIVPPGKKNALPEGLLIFDTQETGRFSEKECVNLFGYIAHLLYELLIEYSNYENER